MWEWLGLWQEALVCLALRVVLIVTIINSLSLTKHSLPNWLALTSSPIIRLVPLFTCISLSHITAYPFVQQLLRHHYILRHQLLLNLPFFVLQVFDEDIVQVC